MTEEFLSMIKMEVNDKLKENKLYNKKVDRVNKLLQYKCVLEYFSLIEKEPIRLNYMNCNFDDIVSMVFDRNIYRIKENETNHIYVYSGTYKCDDCIDIVHGPSAIAVSRYDSRAEYRTYHDLEQFSEIEVPIRKCDDFEKNNYILFVRRSDYYQLRKEFIVDAVNLGQKESVRKVLKKYYDNR